MGMNFRIYNPEKDKEAVHRIWREIGWIDDDDDEKALDIFLTAGRVLLADLNDEAECLAASMPGAIRYLDEDLSFSAITAVTTGRVARKQGLARRLTARLIAEDAADGALVSSLGIFDQGFYDHLGFGVGSYEHWIGFNPAYLKITKKPRAPRRIVREDYEKVHRAMLGRMRRHGACNLFPLQNTDAEMRWTSDGFGLGYFDDPESELSHFFWARAKGEHGPYTVIMMAYQSWEQFLELMALLKTLGDQVHLVWMREPGEIQVQDLIEQPFQQRRITKKSEFENINRATAYWQVRVCDLPGCLAKTHLPGDEMRFNLSLNDPVSDYLPADSPWRGLGGNYVATLGPSSSAEPGADPTLPTLKASVGAFTRLWLGVRSATGLSVSDNLSGPPELLEALDHTLRLPVPHLDWDF